MSKLCPHLFAILLVGATIVAVSDYGFSRVEYFFGRNREVIPFSRYPHEDPFEYAVGTDIGIPIIIDEVLCLKPLYFLIQRGDYRANISPAECFVHTSHDGYILF